MFDACQRAGVESRPFFAVAANMSRIAFQWVALILSAVVSPGASGADSTWQLQLANNERMATGWPSVIVPTENGFGVLRFDHLMRFDLDGNFLEETWLPRIPAGVVSRDVVVKSRSCTRHVLPWGDVVYEYSNLTSSGSFNMPVAGNEVIVDRFDSLYRFDQESGRLEIGEVLRISPDCTPVSISNLNLSHIRNSPNERAAYGLLHADASNASETIALVRFNDQGPHWQLPLSDLVDGAVAERIVAKADGGALLTLSIGAWPATRHEIVSVDANGTEQWRWTAPGTTTRTIAMPSGATAVAQNEPSDVLHILSSDGRPAQAPMTGVRIHELHVVGQPRENWPYVLVGESGLGARTVLVKADGGIEELRRFASGFAPRTQLSEDRFVDDREFLHVVDGERRPITEASIRTRPVEQRIKATAVQRDGVAAILEAENDQAKLVLVDRHGDLRWERPLPRFSPRVGLIWQLGPNWRILNTAHAVCVSYSRHWDEYDSWSSEPIARDDLPAALRCYARDTGAESSSDLLRFSHDGGAPKLFSLPSGGLLAVSTSPPNFVEMIVREYGSRGEFLHEKRVNLNYVPEWPSEEPFPVEQIDRLPSGEWSIYLNDRVQRRNPDLSLRWDSELPSGWQKLTYVSAPSSDGRVVVGGTLLSGGAAIAQLGDDGKMLWQRPYEPTSVFDFFSGDVGRFAPIDDDWLDINERVSRLSGETGETIFSSRARVPESPDSSLVGSLSSVHRVMDGRYLALVEQLAAGSRITWVDVVDGSIAGASALGNHYAKAVQVELRDSANDGSTLVLQTGIGDADHALRIAEVDFRGDLAGPRPTIAQPSVHGVWYEPSSTGQGFFLDYAAGQITGSWFTYTSIGGHDRSQQRWYTLAGTVEPGSERVTLTMYQNSGGHFDAGPTTDSVPVGTVDLQFNRCDELVAVARFDSSVEDPSPQVRVLQRLVPALHSCTNASGEHVGETSAEFARRSGAWFEPNTSGQGLFFDVRASQSNAAAQLVAGWFTYDPEGSHDDPLAQHWFTLLGPIDLESDTATLTINRTIGGSLGGEPTTNTLRVGQATLRFDQCVGATLDYRFDDSELAASFRGLHGSLALQPLTACSTGP